MYFIFQRIFYCSAKADFCFFLYIVQNIHQVCIQLVDGVGVAWMERHRNHRTDLA